jgi:hypothetical protein
MADDPTGRPKPTARRRRAARSTASKAASGTPSTVDPEVIEPVAPVDQAAAAVAGEAPGDVVAEATLAGSRESIQADRSEATMWPQLDGRSPNEWICPFLRSVDDREHANPPIEAPDVANRCAALDEPVPQSLRQQELVCLTTSHVNCPRYLRGAVVVTDPITTPVKSTPTITPAMLGALGLLAAAFIAAVVFAFARGGLNLPGSAAGSAVPSSSVVAVVPSPSPSAGPSVQVSEPPSAGPSVTPAPTPSPVPTTSPAPTPSPTVAATPTPAPSSDRYALLTACPDKPDCWIYRIRSGDNLFSIARYFGVPLATIKALNPWTASGLRVGRALILPPPTR